MQAFTSSLLMVALAEMGDKTQLIALAFAGRYPIVKVVTGVCLGIAATNLLAAACGTLIGAALPVAPIKFIAGLAFIAFAIWSLRNRCDEETCAVGHQRSPVLGIAAGFFAAELGDKTQLTALTLAADSGQFLPVWAGSSLGMALAVAIAIAVGTFAHRSLPERAICWASSLVFAVFGVLTLIDAISCLG
jgi:putative Ca2+/H+ antiporter (TMEM165/GDT1 family)